MVLTEHAREEMIDALISLTIITPVSRGRAYSTPATTPSVRERASIRTMTMNWVNMANNPVMLIIPHIARVNV